MDNEDPERTCMEVMRVVDRSQMRFPWSRHENVPEFVRGYVDLRDRDWLDVDKALDWEVAALDRLDAPQATDDERWNEPEELLPEDEEMTIVTSGLDFGVLDIGVVAAVTALSAAGCVTIVSCNGAVGHSYTYPLVVFYAPPDLVDALLSAAEEAGCGLINAEDGMLELYATNVRKMPTFARVLGARRGSAHS